MTIKEPSTPQEYEAYYTLRWKVLREPWGKPLGSERDGMEKDCVHAMAVDEQGALFGVIRLQQNNSNEGQVRFMGVDQNKRSNGVGSSLLKYMENKAREKKMTSLTLHARENAINFYLKNGYQLIAKSYLMWDSIQHFLMEKKL
ncbi:MAG: GNAT family N-acetyltransferase [Bacteroidetes bacterium]|nr:GNAT family N-acetyltransferase [Bacteroidota bacterium]HET6245297.1 GNAT family N-acetyltransferase [Bacteroidia bacterium]